MLRENTAPTAIKQPVSKCCISFDEFSVISINVAEIISMKRTSQQVTYIKNTSSVSPGALITSK